MRKLALLAALFMVIAACGGSDTAATSTTTTELESTSTSSSSTSTTLPGPTTTTVAAGAPSWPLTGLPMAAGAVIEEPTVIAAKIDNTSAGRPQEGLEVADVVFEVLVEGGIPRLIALFQSEVPDVIGPIRSLREVDPKLVAPFGVEFVNSGGDAPIRALLTGVAQDIGDPLLGASAYFRASDRSAPYDLMFDGTVVSPSRTFVPDGGYEEKPLFFGEAPPGDDQALSVEVAMSAGHTANYRWSSADQAYLRFNGERAHEAVSGGQIMAQNVIVVFARQFDTGRRDRAGSIVPDYDVTGTGPAVVFRNGNAFEGTWERGSLNTFFRFFDAAGEPVALDPGATWVQIVPIGRSVSWG